jgi:hypothetical protein
MNFLFPAAFFFSALSLVIVALYLRRPRRRSLKVSTLIFWRRVFERQPHRRFLGRLRNPLSLLLQLLIFVLLLLALARPQEASPRGRRSTVVVLDARARMQAPGVFRDAVLAAQDIVSRLAPNEEVAILALEGPPRIVSRFANDQKDLRQKLASLAPSDAGGDMGDTLVLARRLLEARPGDKRLVLISDRKTPEAGDAEQIAVGQARENMGILAFAQRALPISPQSAELFLRLENFSSSVRNAEIEFSLDGRPFDLQRFQIGPGDQQNSFAVVPKEMLVSGEGLLVARLTSADAQAIDDTVYGALPTGERLRVLLIGEDDPFLENALKADPSLAVEMLTPELWRSEMGADFDAVVFDNWLPKDATLETLGRGSFFFFGRTPFDVTGEESHAASLEPTESESPLLWNVDIGAIRLARAVRLSIPVDGQWRRSVPVESAGEPMIAALESPQGTRVVVAAFAVADSNFPLRVGFPLFVSNVVHWLAGRRTESEAERKAGETFIPVKGESISRDPITQKTVGNEKPSPAVEGPVKLTRNGFYKVHGPAGSRWLAINTADAAESDLRSAESTANNSPILSRSWRALQSWRWLALAAAILIATEWLLHHRRITE